MPERKRPAAVPCCYPPDCCDMRGMLSFLIMHLLSKKDMYGSEIADALGARKAEKPNPGTLYPTLKDMEERGVVQSYKDGNLKYYRLTKEGREGLRKAKEFFIQAYGDILEDRG
ncbi:MAG: PadR family transcriptional regulator [Thermoplasmata archaeon]|nr:PadR family transcriptional regulator [Thermoplasmata archaeon]